MLIFGGQARNEFQSIHCSAVYVNEYRSLSNNARKFSGSPSIWELFLYQVGNQILQSELSGCPSNNQIQSGPYPDLMYENIFKMMWLITKFSVQDVLVLIATVSSFLFPE